MQSESIVEMCTGEYRIIDFFYFIHHSIKHSTKYFQPTKAKEIEKLVNNITDFKVKIPHYLKF